MVASCSSDGKDADVDIDGVAYGFMASAALFAGLELGIFDKIDAAGSNGISATQLKSACGIDAPRLQTLLTSLVALKCLKLDKSQTYTNSANVTNYLVSSAKGYYGDYLKYQMGRLFYHRMGDLPTAMSKGEAPDYASWFSDPEVASLYTSAQHNGSLATAKQLVKRVDFSGTRNLLDVGGGSGAFSIVFARTFPALEATVLELPEVCKTGRSIVAQDPNPEVQKRVSFKELDATSPNWPVASGQFCVVLMSYLSGSVPEPVIRQLYANAWKALRPGGRLVVHDFMVDDSLDGPALGALWALQHVTVNPEGLGLCPKEIVTRMVAAGFSTTETSEMIGGMTKVVVGHK